jgi:predicted Zn finger-like uncharacterized protein
MLIVCPNCATSYMVDEAALGPEGRTVRCVRCRHTWFASAQDAAPAQGKFAGGVIMEAGLQSANAAAEPHEMAAEGEPPPAPPPSPAPGSDDDFGAESEGPVAAAAPADGPDDVTLDNNLPAESATPHLDSPPLVPPTEHEPLPAAEAGDAESDDVESYAARRQRLQARRKQSRRSSRWIALVLVLLAANVAVIGGREEVVRYLPQTASLFSAIGLPVNLRHLRFENVKITRDTQDSVDVLVVEGDIVSTAGKPIAVPRLRFAARDAAGQEIYTWTALPSRSILNPGEKLPFRSRLASPPEQARSVLVRFFNAEDEASGSTGATGKAK